MKPSNEPNVIAILDTLPECKVVLDALEDPIVPRPQIGPGIDELVGSVGMRFRWQTQYEPRPPFASSYIELEWKDQPEFRVEVQDIAFVKKAAENVINEKRFLNRAFNVVTHRKHAAETILRFMSSNAALIQDKSV